MKKKIVTIVGARPQLIKSAMISMELIDHEQLQEIYVHTGQHYDQNMSEIFFHEMKIPAPHYNLQIGSGLHGEQTAKMLTAIEDVLLHEKPDAVLVYGDTNSTLSGALAAVKLHIPVAHVEAGLRSFNRKMPEEINRIVTDHVSDLLFAPTELATKHLHHEGIDAKKIFNVGDVMYDMFIYFGRLAESKSKFLAEHSLTEKNYILATIHRAENTNDEVRLRAIIDSLCEIADKKMPVILPLHPRTKHYLEQLGLIEKAENKLLITEPVGLLDMLSLEKNASLIVTDSGGVQKEAYFAEVPCVTLREETEWQELIDMKWNRLADPYSASFIVQAIQKALNSQGQMDLFPFGKGDAAKIIITHLLDRL